MLTGSLFEGMSNVNQTDVTPPTPLPTNVVFIDGDWLSVGTQQGRIPLSYSRLMSFLKTTFGEATAVRMYLSATTKGRGASRLADTLNKLGITVHVIPMVPHGKSNIDMRLAIDATALPAHIQTFALVSGDSDFVPLLNRMNETGRRTILISFPLMLSTLLRDAADEFINLETVVTGGSTPEATHPPRPASQQVHYRPPSQIVIDKGEHLKPYLIIRKLLVAAQKDVCIIDPYLGVELFELLACLQMKVSVSMITDEKHLPPDLRALVTRCRKEGRQLRVYISRDVHDRYMRIDDDWWHSGHSFKDLGSRVSQLTHVEPANGEAMRQIERRTLVRAKELYP
jgi:hypothetical protein